MRKQKAVAVQFDTTGKGALDVAQLDNFLEQGWTVNQMAESGIGPVLVILDAPKEE